jgi:hypothetical protein
MNFKNPLLWTAFLLYLFVAGISLVNHEMWADELHSWNIAKGSQRLTDIFRNSRYEGHPPLWYIILWTISRFTHNLVAVQVVHLFIAAVPVFLLLFFSRIPIVTRLLIPFGYYLLFEYSVLSRNYAIAILLASLICMLMRRNVELKNAWYYLLLFLLTNTHLLGALLAGSLHVYFLFLQWRCRRSLGVVTGHMLIGLLVALPAICLMMPPEGSMLGARRQTVETFIIRVKTLMQAPLLSMLPIPAWWQYNWWNTQFLLEANSSRLVRVLIPVFSIALLALPALVLKKDKKSIALFYVNLILSAAIALTVLTLAAARYTGFIYMAFIFALWLYYEECALEGWRKIIVNVLLLSHVVAGASAVVKDIRFPFSNSYRVKDLLVQVPKDKQLVCDYWAVNTYSAYLDIPVYCIDVQKEMNMILFDNDLREKLSDGSRYTLGLQKLQQTAPFTDLFMLSTHPPGTLAQIDSVLNRQYEIILVDKRDGAIEKFSNLYLYQIRVR